MNNSDFRSSGERIGRGLFWLLFVCFTALPLLWVVLVSLQATDALSANRYSLFPREISFRAYQVAMIQNYRGIRSSLVYSLLVSAISATGAMVAALSASYLVNGRVLSLKWRRRIVLFALSLFFLPAFAVYPGVEVLEHVFPWFRRPGLELTVIQSIQAFPVAFVLLLALFASLSRLDFEQLLIETGSRVKAFWWGVVARRPAGVVSIATITFAFAWSEFYVTGFMTTRDQAKPFSVLLQMFQEQYRTDYASLAAGAVISLIMSLGSIGLGALGVASYQRARIGIARKRNRG
jgi:ABC-type glycerol-3-phosphate transport system permease component